MNRLGWLVPGREYPVQSEPQGERSEVNVGWLADSWLMVGWLVGDSFGGW